ncbi:metallophosphoesterase [Candidatus Shapirobacteria bacterium]|nr:metallophosphoesterase [Candidatus Shapirobacteria bacterium]
MKKFGVLLVIASTVFVWFWFNRFRIQEPIAIDVKVSPTQAPKKIKIAFMSDVHTETESLKKALMVAKEEMVDQVVLIGDLTNKGDEKSLYEIKKVMDDSGISYASVPGNHEYSLDNYIKIFGNNYGTIEEDFLKLILIDNSYWGGFSEEQIKWMEIEMSDCKKKICLAVMHKPINNLFSSHVMGEGSHKVAMEAEWLRQLMINSGIKRVMAGHLHYASSYELEGIRTDLVGAISKERNTQSARFTILEISVDEIERKVVEINDDTGN